MNHDADYAATGSSGNGKLRQWLIDQVESGTYPGLVWEDGEKSIFRIPWKHAGKQDYNRDEDAALFKAWALFKGKFREGVDKADPPTWKTRLRCALNKSNDFEELLDRSQLDISDPYKVYRVIPEGAKRRPRQEDSPLSPVSYTPYQTLPSQMQAYMPVPPEWREYYPEQASHPELHIPQCSYSPHPWGGPPMENAAYQIKGSFYSYKHADIQPPAFTLDPGVRAAESLSDLRLHVSVFHRDSLVREVTSSNPKGCMLVPWPQEEKAYVPGGPDLIPLPPDSPSLRGRPGDEGPPEPLSAAGVQLWMTTEGVYARRLGQESVYWQGGLGPYAEKLHKMERDVSCEVLHTQDFLTEFQGYRLTGRPVPPFQAVLCFGDECVDPERPRRTLSVQVEPLFAKQPFYCAQPSGGHYYRGYEHHGAPEHVNHSEAYRQALSDRYHSMMQE